MPMLHSWRNNKQVKISQIWSGKVGFTRQSSPWFGSKARHPFRLVLKCVWSIKVGLNSGNAIACLIAMKDAYGHSIQCA